MEDVQDKAWADAQALPISIDLVTAATEELLMLAEVDRHKCLYSGPVVARAIERYENLWLPLLANEGSASQDPLLPLIPPLDCAWIWHVHRLNPTRYIKDCEELYGRVLDASMVNPADKGAATEATMKMWVRLYPDEPYNIDFSHIQSQEATGSFLTKEKGDHSYKVEKITYNLVDAVARQQSFFYQVSQPFVMQESFLKSAEQRYRGFLYLFALNKGLFLVPTYDIDIMWHAHQLSPAAYSRDCLAILKKVLDHDDTDSDRSAGKKLNTGFKDTCELWEQTFGSIYVKAGAMYRGDQPLDIPPSSADSLPEVSSGSFDHKEWETCLTPRHTVQVCLVLLGAKDVPINRVGPTLFIRVKVLHKCGSFSIDTHEVPTYSDPVWRKMYMFKFETSTEGVVLQLRSTQTGLFSTASKLLGEAYLTCDDLLASPSLSIRKWLPLNKRKFSPFSATMSPTCTALNVSASITPPVAAPYLLRTLDESAQIYNANDGAFDAERIVFDHTDKETITVRLKCVERELKEVILLQGVQRPSRFSKTKDYSGQCVAQARPISSMEKKGLGQSREWLLFDGYYQLTIQKNAEDPQWHLRPELTLQSKNSSSVLLISGRKLDYEVNGATAEEEAGFVTLIRFPPGSPSGMATALFNFKSGAMEVKPDENVALVVLLGIIISLSVVEISGENRLQPQKQVHMIRKGRPSGIEWGAVTLERQANEKSDIARKLALYNFLNYHYWWDMPFNFWCASFYDNSSLLSDETVYQDGVLIGDGRWTYHS